MKLNVLRADPAGNITLFVLDEVDKTQRAAVASKLMELPHFKAEQVGFVCQPREGGEGRMEMAGGEFCGNATRAFGLLTSRKNGNRRTVTVEVSGCGHPVSVEVNPVLGRARAEMPLPLWSKAVTVDAHRGVLVHLGGIAHLVVEDMAPSRAFFDAAEPLFQDIPDLDAYGVIFLDLEHDQLTPLVKVPAASTLVWEGSCGSGTLAAAVAQSERIADGSFYHDYVQPAGLIRATVVRTDGKVTEAYIGGPVTLDEPVVVEI